MKTYTADEVDAMIGRALARERERTAQQQEPVTLVEHWCTYCQGHNPHLCQFNQTKHWPQTYVTNNTSPQPSKPWVRLTEDEWDEIERIAPTVGDAIRMTQFKLREKNHG